MVKLILILFLTPLFSFAGLTTNTADCPHRNSADRNDHTKSSKVVDLLVNDETKEQSSKKKKTGKKAIQ